MWIKPSNEVAKRAQRLKIQRQVQHFTSAQPGSRYILQSWKADGVEPTSQILFLHGALSHGGRHQDMFDWMIKHYDGKIVVHALDCVGHGLASGTRAHVEKFGYWVEDLISTLGTLKESGPLALMGHSMGGLIALKALLECEQQIPSNVGPLILSNPCIRPIQVVDFPKIETVLNGIADKLPTTRFPRFHKGIQLANNPEAANSFETDPLVSSFITARMTREIWYASQAVRPLSYFLKRPTLFLVSDMDLVVDREATLLFSRGIDKRFAKVLEYQNVKHELLHEANKQQVWKDTAQWLESL